MEIEYRTIDKLNQSLLKEILKSPGSFVRAQEKYMQKEKTIPSHFVFGSAVDHMITEDVDFNDKFYVMGESAVSDTIKTIVDYVHDEFGPEEFIRKLEDCRDSIVRACSYVNYGQAWKEDTRINKVIEQGQNYFKDLAASAGKTIISSEDFSKAVVAHASMMSDPYMSKYLKPKESHMELVKKKVIEFEYDGIPMKCELDLVFINHKLNTITPIDVKTTGNTVYGFPYTVWKYRYDFQAAVYHFALEQAISGTNLNNYHINHFKWFVVEKESVNHPLIYKANSKVLEIGFKGGTLSNGKVLEGFYSAIERYKFHKNNDKWNYPMEYYGTTSSNPGEIILSV